MSENNMDIFSRYKYYLNSIENSMSFSIHHSIQYESDNHLAWFINDIIKNNFSINIHKDFQVRKIGEMSVNYNEHIMALLYKIEFVFEYLKLIRGEKTRFKVEKLHAGLYTVLKMSVSRLEKSQLIKNLFIDFSLWMKARKSLNSKLISECLDLAAALMALVERE